MDGFTLIDGVVAAVIVLSAVLAYARGLVRESMAILGWIGAAVLAYMFAAQAQPLFGQRRPGQPLPVAAPAAPARRHHQQGGAQPQAGAQAGRVQQQQPAQQRPQRQHRQLGARPAVHQDGELACLGPLGAAGRVRGGGRDGDHEVLFIQ